MANNDNSVVTGDPGAIESLNGSKYLDLEDELWSLGVGDGRSDTVQVVFAGDYSLGKCLVMSALTRGDLVANKVLCGPIASKITWSRGADVGHEVRITGVPGELNESYEERIVLPHPNPSLEEEINNALLIINNQERTELFLQARTTYPNSPELSIISLPGLFHDTHDNVPLEQDTRTLAVFSYFMRQPHTVGVIVAAAEPEFPVQFNARLLTLQQFCNKLLGVITIPPPLQQGFGAENFYCELARQQPSFLAHGWHVLCSLGNVTCHTPMAEKDAMDDAFFARNGWAALRVRGNSQFQRRVAAILFDLVRDNRNSLAQNAARHIQRCEQRPRLGQPRNGIDNHSRLLHLSTRFQEVMATAIVGPGRPFALHWHAWLRHFAYQMHTYGGWIHIHHVDDQLQRYPQQRCLFDGLCVSLPHYEATIKAGLARMGAGQSSGSWNPVVVAELFSMQSKP